MICRIFRCHLALFAMKLNLYLPLRYFNHPELSAINLSLHWLTRHGCESVNTKWDSFTTFQEYFNFSIVEMSVPRLMKYCPYQTNEVDRVFHISPLQTFPLLFPGAITSFIKLTHNSVPQLIFLSFFTSCLGGCLCFVYVSVSLVIGAAADMSLVVIRVSPPRYWVSALLPHSLTVPNVVVSGDIWFVVATQGNTCCLQDLNLKTLIWKTK